jgi:hypothetical protein
MVDKQGELLTYLQVNKTNKTLKSGKNGFEPGNMEDDEGGNLSTGKKWAYGMDFEEESKKDGHRADE